MHIIIYFHAHNIYHNIYHTVGGCISDISPNTFRLSVIYILHIPMYIHLHAHLVVVWLQVTLPTAAM